MNDPKNPKPESEPSGRWVRVVYGRNSLWQPATDAFETPDRFIVIVELAGMKHGDFTVNLVERRLIITGKRRRPMEELEQAAFHQLEIRYGDFRTEILVPWPVDREGIAATYEDGFLKIELPRREQNHTIRVVDVHADEDE